MGKSARKIGSRRYVVDVIELGTDRRQALTICPCGIHAARVERAEPFRGRIRRGAIPRSSSSSEDAVENVIGAVGGVGAATYPYLCLRDYRASHPGTVGKGVEVGAGA